MSAHLDTDALADVLAGVGHPDHLDECAECQHALTELSAAMASVTVALAQLPEPVVPADLTARITAALGELTGAPEPAEAAPAPVAAPAPLPAAVSSTITPMDVKRSGPPAWTKYAGGLAAAAALVVGVVLVTSSGSSSGTKQSPSEAADIARNDTGTAYTKDAASLTRGLPALLKGNAPGSAVAQGAAAPTASESPKTTAAQNQPLPVSPVDELAALRGKTALAACLASLSDPSDPGIPLALDYGTFEGKPALLVILPSAKKTSVLAFFVGPECNATDSHLLFYEKVPAP